MAQAASEPPPEPNNWPEILPRLRLARPIHIALPCVGIDGAGWALKHLGVPFKACNIFDVESRYGPYLREMLPDCHLHLGKSDGDVAAVPLTRWERPVHLLCSGPPCPPWAGGGKKLGANDPRAGVFLAVVRACVALIKAGDLLACVLENVVGITHKQRGDDMSFLDKVVTILREEVPEFHWAVARLCAREYCLAQERTRIFLRGIRRHICGEGVPEPLPPFGSKRLQEFLTPAVPPVKRAELTENMQKNLRDAQTKIREMLRARRAAAEDVFVFPLDRADDKVFKRQVCLNCTPTLTTCNTYLFVSDARIDAEDAERAYFRFLLPEERFVLQGFPGGIAKHFPTKGLQLQASGNAYPVPLMAAALAPLLERFPRKLPLGRSPLEMPHAVENRLQDAMYGDRSAQSSAKGKRAKPKRKPKAMKARPARTRTHRGRVGARAGSSAGRTQNPWEVRGFLSSSSGSSLS